MPRRKPPTGRSAPELPPEPATGGGAPHDAPDPWPLASPYLGGWDELAGYLRTTVTTLQRLRVENPEAFPEPWQPEGSRLLLFLKSDADAWVQTWPKWGQPKRGQ